MLNTGLRTGELLGLLNSDINLEGRYLEVRQNVKEVCRREGTDYVPGREVKVGKTKTATSKRRVPLNQAAEQAIREFAPGARFRDRFAPCERREGRLHQAGELPQEVLSDSQGGRYRAERASFTQTSFCYPIDKRRKTAGRYDSRLITPPSSRPARSQHIADNGDVLCQERHHPPVRNNGWIRVLITF